MQRLSIIVGRLFYLLIAIFLVFGPYARAALPCSEGKGLTSNYILSLVGAGDTLWMLTAQDNSLALNMIAGKRALSDPSNESNWWSYTLGCKKDEGVVDVALGGGYAVVCFDSAAWHKPNAILSYNHRSATVEEFSFLWDEALKHNDTPFDLLARDAVWSSDRFFFACGDGGLVGWDPARNIKTVYTPGTDGGELLANYDAQGRAKPDTALAVIRVDGSSSDSVVVVTTPHNVWRFRTTNETWDSIVTLASSSSAQPLLRFENAFVNYLDASRPLYSIVRVAADEGRSDTRALWKYNRKVKVWEPLFATAPSSLTFGYQGFLYALFDDTSGAIANTIRIYRDTMGDSGVVAEPNRLFATSTIHNRMIYGHDIDIPKVISDVSFVPRPDSAALLWIATSEGLFLDSGVTSFSDSATFILIKRAPVVAATLKETYARPGILNGYAPNCKFIYNLSHDASVTIRVYDYNMDLVKTVIEKRFRRAGNNGGPRGRSTVESEDTWDGKNSCGRKVAPGVYYYKITTDNGERSFGKLVVAK